MSKYYEHLHLVCTCLSSDHLIEFMANPDPDPEDEDVFWVNVQLHSACWYRRLWKGLKYIFGYTCVYGHWDTGSFNEDESRRLIAFIAEHLEKREKEKGNG